MITAAGEGSAAAIAINTDLVQEDVQSALSRISAESDGRPHQGNRRHPDMTKHQ